ncbi:MAG: DUF4160 domain-containing protein [Thermoanaerobaculales bacterium]|nr:DUF4160 domain-containing protein [Thermoanaerobaculales bacterium]
MAPTVDRIGPYRFFFFSNESGEPAHIHVQRDQQLAKFWLGPAHLAGSTRFAAHELAQIERIVTENRIRFLEAWNGYHDS